MADIKLSDSDNETVINLWHTEPALWDSSQLINSNADARKATLSRISKEKIEGSRHKCVIMLDFKFIILSFTSINNEY